MEKTVTLVTDSHSAFMIHSGMYDVFGTCIHFKDYVHDPSSFSSDLINIIIPLESVVSLQISGGISLTLTNSSTARSEIIKDFLAKAFI